MGMNIYVSFVRRILIIMAVITIIGAISLFALNWTDCITGWLWGCLGNILYFSMLAFRVKKVEQEDPKKAARNLQKSLFSRFALIVFFVLIGSRIPGVDLLAVLFGLLILKPALYIDFLLNQEKHI